MSLEKARKQVRAAYLFATITGIVLAFGFLSADETNYAIWLMLIPMAFYILYGYQRAVMHRYMTEFADSVYYLGFSFTLISLLAATVFEKLSADPTKTITYFGMALATTIFGLLFRNYHLQFIDLNEDPLEKAKRDLEKEVSNFHYMGQMLSEQMKNIYKNYEETNNKLIDTMPVNLEKAINLFEDNLINILSKLESNVEQVDSYYAEINESTKNRYQNLDQLTESSSNTLYETLQKLNDTITKEADEIGLAIARTKLNTIELNEKIDRRYESLLNQTDNEIFDKTFDSIQLNSEKSLELTSHLNKVNDSFKGNIKQLNNLSKTLTKEVSQINKIFSDLEKAIAKNLE